MIDTPAIPSPWSPNIPNFLTYWNSSALGTLKECPALFNYTYVEQWQPASKGVHLAFGGWYAAGLEHYAKVRASGLSHDAASISMVRYVLAATWIDGAGWAPPPDHKDASIKNRVNLIRSLIWNVEERLTSPFQTYIKSTGRAAVEESFLFHAFNIEGEDIHFAGHLDEIVQDEGSGLWVRDDKTTKSALSQFYFTQFTPNNQMSLYSIAGKVVLGEPVRGVLVKAAQIGVNFTRFATAQVPRPQAVLDEWLLDSKQWISQARHYAITGHWPRNDKSCGNWGGCPFQKVCAVSPSHRAAWLAEDFVRAPPLNPLEQRGE